MYYLQVPNLNVSILDVEDSALFRFDHFRTHAKLCNKPMYLKYLKNSSLLDYAGFLCLRTHASLTNNDTLKELIIEGECNLIAERLSLLKPNYLRKHLIKTIDDIGLLNNQNDDVNILLKFCSEYKKKQHVPCSEHCTSEYIKVPWQKCVTLVSNRKVELTNGVAIVPCSLWNSVLIDLFHFIYIKSLKKLRCSISALPEKDLQIEYLSDKINRYYYSKVDFWKNTHQLVSLKDIFSNKQLFPPCMLLSLKSLCTNHRLAHDPRYHLTLFLKEIGVPLDQCLMLFEQEYSMCGNSKSTCTHTWEGHNKKIEYYTRHTYGVVGSKKNYKMISCAKMQKKSFQVSDEGCCPFVHYNENELKIFLEELTSISDEEMNILKDLKNSDQPIRACHWYAHKLFEMSEPLYHNTPTQYYFNSTRAKS